jgi:hypothetical protein
MDMTDLFATEMMLSQEYPVEVEVDIHEENGISGIGVLEGDLSKLREETAQLLSAFLNIMMPTFSQIMSKIICLYLSFDCDTSSNPINFIDFSRTAYISRLTLCETVHH